MRLTRGVISVAFCLECLLPAQGSAADILPVAGPAPRYAPPGSLLAGCTETATVTEPKAAATRKPVRRKRTARKPVHRKTAAARPHKPVKKVVKKSTTPVKHKVAHKPTKKRPVHHRRTVAKKPAPRPIVHRVTYASPICEDRAPVINELLGLSDLPVFEGPILPGPDDEITPKAFAALPREAPALAPPPSRFPNFPGVLSFLPPPGGGFPPGGGDTPPGGGGDTPPGGGGDTPPPTVAVPEPATWAMMILGMGMAGYAIRRRRRARASRRQQSQ